MVNVNRNTLKKDELERLIHRFDKTVSKMDCGQTTMFFDELLGQEERLTLAKRLAAIILLLEDYSEYKTAKLLKLSPTTTDKIARQINNGSFAGIISILGKSKNDYFAILKVIDDILHLGGVLPHRTGLDRYRGIR